MTGLPRTMSPRGPSRPFAATPSAKRVGWNGILRGAAVRCAWAMAIGMSGLIPIAAEGAGIPAEKNATRSGFVAQLTPEESQLVNDQMAAAREVSVLQANIIHARFLDRCLEPLPEGVALGYGGMLCREGSRTGQRIVGSFGSPVEWDVHKNIAVFSFWVSTRRTKDTLATCSIEGKDIFVNVSFVDENRSVDAKLPELGGRSVREVVSAIERPSAEEKTQQR